jgi:hypothetical protein
MTTEHRKSPRRSVERIERIGNWGTVKYHHHLECGHIEIRPRASTAPKIACVWCLKATERDAEWKNPGAIDKNSVISLDYDLDMGQDEIRIEGTRAALSRELSIPPDAIDIVAVDAGGTLEIQSALVFLSSDDVKRITKRKA